MENRIFKKDIGFLNATRSDPENINWLATCNLDRHVRQMQPDASLLGWLGMYM
jgi:hypothetical protein